VVICLSVIGMAVQAARPEPTATALAAALKNLHTELDQARITPAQTAKLDARLRMLVAPAEHPLASKTPGKVSASALKSVSSSVHSLTAAKRAQLAVKPGATGLQNNENLQGLEGLYRFESLNGVPALGVVVISDSPGLLPEIAKQTGAVYEGETFPENKVYMTVPICSLVSLLQNPDVKKIQAPVQNRPYMNNALVDTHTTVVHSLWKYHGSGAIYAAVDTGIDWSQQDFKNPDGTTRILYIWDQTSSAGTPPAGYSYGTEWSSTQINAGTCTEADDDTPTWGHGTSTTGVGAGNGSSTGGTYMGQADEADIILVKSDLTDTHIEDGLRYIKDKAANLGRPVSINMSFGSGWGPHDGGDDLSYWIDNSFGVTDSSQGIVLSAAAGNDTGNNQHVDGAICGEANPTTGYNTDDTNVLAYSYDWNGNGYTGQQMAMEWYLPASANVEVRAWIPADYRGSWTYIPTSWLAVDPSNSGYYNLPRTRRLDSFVGDPTTTSDSDTFGVYLDFQKPMTDYNNSALQYVYVAYDYASTSESSYGGDLYYKPSGWSGPMPIIIQFRQDGGSGSGATIDGYLPSWTYGYFASETEDCTNRYLGGDSAKMINGPAAAHEVIAVGAHVTKTSWTDRNGTPQSTSETLNNIASYSSHGPLRGAADGDAVVNDQKPNLTAPGEVIVTSLSSQLGSSWYSGSPQDSYIVQETPADKHIAESGTSFCSPQVAGAAAIMLGTDPSLTLGQIRNYLQNNARSDSFTGTTPNDVWGYGKLTLDNAIAPFAKFIYKGTDASNLPLLQGASGDSFTDVGAVAEPPNLYFYKVDGVGDTLRLSKSGDDVVLNW
jgi:hypothetical protein